MSLAGNSTMNNNVDAFPINVRKGRFPASKLVYCRVAIPSFFKLKSYLLTIQ